MIVRVFIEKFWIENIGSLIENYPFQSFILMATGIELLGKCLSEYDWDVDGKSSEEFKIAIDNLYSFERYRKIDHFYNKLRCGLVHLGIPKVGIKLDRRNNSFDSDSITLGCEEFYNDFKNACIEVLEDKEGKVRKNIDEEYAEIDGSTTGTTTNK